MSSEEKNYYLWRCQSDLNFTTPLVHLRLFCDATSKLSILVPGVFKNPCLIVSYSAIALCSFFCEKCRSIRSRCSFFRICRWFTISWKKSNYERRLWYDPQRATFGNRARYELTIVTKHRDTIHRSTRTARSRYVALKNGYTTFLDSSVCYVKSAL